MIHRHLNKRFPVAVDDVINLQINQSFRLPHVEVVPDYFHILTPRQVRKFSYEPKDQYETCQNKVKEKIQLGKVSNEPEYSRPEQNNSPIIRHSTGA